VNVNGIPLVADASSHFLSRPLEVSKFGLIYAGAQKNVGPAGLTIVIVREDLLGNAAKGTPSVMDYKLQAGADSMLNTPPTYSIYIAGLLFKWVKQQGGVREVEKRNIQKAALLYDVLDSSGFLFKWVKQQGGVREVEKRNIQKAALLYDLLDSSSFYKNPVAKEDRSRMNVPFTLADAKLDDAFLKGAQERGMVQLKGHRSVGGMRASIYNAMPLEGVQRLAEYMKEFEAKHG